MASSNSEVSGGSASALTDTMEHQFLINNFFGKSAFLTPTDSFLGQFLETPPSEQS